MYLIGVLETMAMYELFVLDRNTGNRITVQTNYYSIGMLTWNRKIVNKLEDYDQLVETILVLKKEFGNKLPYSCWYAVKPNNQPSNRH